MEFSLAFMRQDLEHELMPSGNYTEADILHLHLVFVLSVFVVTQINSDSERICP